MAGSIFASERRYTGTAIFGLIFCTALSAANTTGLLWVYRCTNAMGILKALLFFILYTAYYLFVTAGTNIPVHFFVCVSD